MPESFADLDRRVVLERASTSQDATGQPVETWAPIATLWASWRRASARETLAAAEVAAAVSDVFVLRWSPLTSGVGPKDRLRYEGRIYNIVEATELARHEGVRIAAAARAE